MQQMEFITECNDQDGTVLLKDKETLVLKNWYQRQPFDYKEGGRGLDAEYFKPSAKMKYSYHLCRFCGGRGCLGCQKERERDHKMENEKA